MKIDVLYVTGGYEKVLGIEKVMELRNDDGDKHNNRLDNLEWVTMEENNFHAYNTLDMKKGKNGNYGFLYEEKIVLQYSLEGGLLREYKTLKSVKKENPKFCLASISTAINKKDGYMYGFRWEYKVKNDPTISWIDNNKYILSKKDK